MKRAIVVSLLVCALIVTAGCLDDGDTEADATMTMQELSNDYSQSTDQANMTMMFYLDSVDEGDTLVIKDTIDSITYDTQNQTTMISFVSTSQSGSMPLRFEGDITDEFSSGDSVAVTTGIINVTMVRQSQQGQVTYHYETFEEGWDAANETSVPFPQSTIELAEATEDTDDENDDTNDGNGDLSNATSITLSQFYNDYKQSQDRENMTATLLLQSFDDGDTVVIEDQLQNLTYNTTERMTVIQFASYPNIYLLIDGDITNEFQAGDTVMLTSEIINTTFTNQNWTVDYETFAGGWDTENNTQAAFPRDALQHTD